MENENNTIYIELGIELEIDESESCLLKITGIKNITKFLSEVSKVTSREIGIHSISNSGFEIIDSTDNYTKKWVSRNKSRISFHYWTVYEGDYDDDSAKLFYRLKDRDLN